MVTQVNNTTMYSPGLGKLHLDGLHLASLSLTTWGVIYTMSIWGNGNDHRSIDIWIARWGTWTCVSIWIVRGDIGERPGDTCVKHGGVGMLGNWIQGDARTHRDWGCQIEEHVDDAWTHGGVWECGNMWVNTWRCAWVWEHEGDAQIEMIIERNK